MTSIMNNQTISVPADTLFLGMHRFRWLATAPTTGGAFSCVEIVAQRGGEPPPHTHTREDQAFFVIDGRVKFVVGDEQIDGGPGSLVWAPRGVPHGFALETDTVKMLEMSTPGGLEDAFLALSAPHTSDALPPLQGPPPAEAVEALVTKFGEHGITFHMN